MSDDAFAFTASPSVWAADVARHFDRFAADRVPTVDDLWVSKDLALHVRYRLGVNRVAARFRLDVDRTSAGAPSDPATLASDLLHNLHASSELEWVDDDGYGWWGDRPPGGWAEAASGDRFLTVR